VEAIKVGAQKQKTKNKKSHQKKEGKQRKGDLEMIPPINKDVVYALEEDREGYSKTPDRP